MFLRMPFGLCSASEVLRSAITRPSGTSHGVHAIADELIIAGRNEQEHDHALSRVLNRARSKNIKFSLDRVLCKVYQVKLVHGAPHWTYQPRRDQIPRGSKQFTRCQSQRTRNRYRDSCMGMIKYLAPFIPGEPVSCRILSREAICPGDISAAEYGPVPITVRPNCTCRIRSGEMSPGD